MFDYLPCQCFILLILLGKNVSKFLTILDRHLTKIYLIKGQAKNKIYDLIAGQFRATLFFISCCSRI